MLVNQETVFVVNHTEKALNNGLKGSMRSRPSIKRKKSIALGDTACDRPIFLIALCLGGLAAQATAFEQPHILCIKADDTTTLAERLKTVGYATGFFGKWHLGNDRKFWPTEHGFDVNVGGCGYGGQIEATDRAVGRVLDELSVLGIAEQTLVILTSDNGGWSGATDNRPLRAGKGHLHEGGLRVPLIVHYPHFAFHKDNRPGSAIRYGHYKLIHYYDDATVELFDLKNDLSKTRNFAQAEPEVTQQLKAGLTKWLIETNAGLPDKMK